MSYIWQEAKAKRNRWAGAWGAAAVRVRPTGLTSLPALKRYQYHRSGRSPCTSACTAWPHSGVAWAVPRRATERNRSSVEISHCTGTGTGGMPPPCSGSGARRVHRTTLSGSGSPEVTPRVNGAGADGRGRAWAPARPTRPPVRRSATTTAAKVPPALPRKAGRSSLRPASLVVDERARMVLLWLGPRTGPNQGQATLA